MALNFIKAHFWLSLVLTILTTLYMINTSLAEVDDVIVKQWGVFEKELITINNYSNSQKYVSVTLVAYFHGPKGAKFAVPGFWDGGNIWRIRFSPTLPGQWFYTIYSSDNQLNDPENDGRFVAIVPTNSDISDNPNYRGFLKISNNRHNLAYEDGTPFFWMGGTIWRGNLKNMAFDPNLDDEGPDVAEFPHYVDNRKSKGFTVMQIIAGSTNTTDRVNEGGATFNIQYSEINPFYFQWFDKRIQYIINKGMVPMIVGQWVKCTVKVPFADLKRYWRYIIARYQAYNVVWCVSGEYGFAKDIDKVRRLGTYIHNTDTVGHLTTIHPTPNRPNASFSSSEHFFNENWIDFHLHQTWDQAATRDTMVRDYSRIPAVPAVNSEAGYDKLWGWEREMVREDAWTVYMSGGAGYTYGVNGIWNWNDGCCDDDEEAHPPRWYDVIDLPSSYDMQRIVAFFSEIKWWELVPRDDLVSVGYALVQPGKEYVVYLPSSSTRVTIDLSAAPRILNLRWFNPETGETIDMGTITGGVNRTFYVPFGGEAVLYLFNN